MLKLAETLLLSIICFAANAQTHHFIYIENTNKQPFTAQLNGNTYEATNKDFIIIPKLARGTYNISISTLIASNKKFTINIDENDLGFSLKQNTNSELVLFDINQFTTIQQDAKYELETVKKNEEKIKQPIVDSPIKTLPIEVAIEPEKKILLQPIKKIYQKQKKDGIDEVYVDISNKKADTISIFIPYQKLKNDTAKETKPPIAAEQKIESKILDIAPVATTNCNTKAIEREVVDFSSRIQETLMLKHKLKLAANTLKEKCFTVSQIKRLGSLFLNESGKFNFYKLAQTAITDANNFASLEKELKDEKIKEEFRALLK